jgi:hypothetical protein
MYILQQHTSFFTPLFFISQKIEHYMLIKKTIYNL